jgi:outer membrane biosynthesis protein TonB
MTTLQTIPTITEKESLLLKGVAKSDYQDGDMIGKQVWSWSATDYLENKRGAGALVASLVRKGLLTHSPKSGDEDECIAFTKLGVEAYRAAFPEAPAPVEAAPEPTPEPTPAPVEVTPTKTEGKVKMTGIANNPARVALLTAMEDQLDDGAKLWEEQPKTRDTTKNALLRDGYVAILKGGKAYITEKGREAVAALAAKGQTSQVALEAGTPTKGEEAKAKFEAARSEVVKPAKPAAPENQEPAGKVRAAQKAVAQYDAKQAKAEKPATKRAAANAKKPEAKTEAAPQPAQQAEQPAPEAPKEQAKPSLGVGYKLAAILRDIYGVGLADAPTLAVIWAASQLADMDGAEVAQAELAEVNKFREQAGVVPAYPPYGSKLFR